MEAINTETTLSVTALTARIKQKLEQDFSHLHIRGEVSRLSRAGSGHLYFTVKDSHATISAVVWRSAAMKLQFMPKEGEAYIFSGHLSVYEPRGSYQLIVHKIQAAGEGLLAAKLEQRKQKLAALGWFDRERKQAIPILPKHIGIVTSATAAALQDVCKVLNTRPGWIRQTLAPCIVQGDRAAYTIVQAIHRLQQLEDVDVILLVRGGGSMEDLWCFNDEAVVRAVAECRIPVISGVGHEIDTTLVDLASDLRAATPSNAAELCCQSREVLHNQLPSIIKLQQLLAQQLQLRQQQTTSQTMMLQQRYQSQQDNRRHHSHMLRQGLQHQSRQAMQHNNQQHSAWQRRLTKMEPGRKLRVQHQQWQNLRLRLATPQQYLQIQRHQLHQVKSRLQEQASMLTHRQKPPLLHQYDRLQACGRQKIEHAHHHYQFLHGKIHGLNPSNVLKRGYALVQGSKQQIYTSAHQLVNGQSADLYFHDGQAEVTINHVQKK